MRTGNSSASSLVGLGVQEALHPPTVLGLNGLGLSIGLLVLQPHTGEPLHPVQFFDSQAVIGTQTLTPVSGSAADVLVTPSSLHSSSLPLHCVASKLEGSYNERSTACSWSRLPADKERMPVSKQWATSCLPFPLCIPMTRTGALMGSPLNSVIE